MSASLFLTVPLAVPSLVVAAFAADTARRGWSGKLTREGRSGVRTEASMSSDNAFRVANKVAAPVIAGAAAIGLAVAAVLILGPILGSLGTVTAVIIGVLGLAALFALLVTGSVFGDRAARTVPRPATRPAGGGGCGGCACGSGGCSGLTKVQPST